jgi:DNA modification methylase
MMCIQCADCLDIIHQIPDHRVDAIIMDPPYSNYRSSRGEGAHAKKLISENPNGALGSAGLAWLMRAIALESCRVVKPSGALLVFCDCAALPGIIPMIEAAGPIYKGIIIWNKEHFGNGVGFRMQHEHIVHFQYGAAKYHNQGTPSVISCTRTKQADQIHINQKPVDLLESLIKVVTPPGGVVLDPFMGSGSTGKACLNLGRHFIGSDINPDHCERAKRWLGVTQRQAPTVA